jgi:hypothetical protein
MKQLLIVLLLMVTQLLPAQEPAYDYVFFTNSRMPGNYFFSRTKAVSPSVVVNERSRLPVSTSECFTPGNSLQLQYTNAKGGSWNATIFKPEIRGQDHFKKAKWLAFHLKRTSTHKDGLPNVQLMTRDSARSKAVTIQAGDNKEWQRIRISLEDFFPGAPIDVRNILGVVFTQSGEDGKQHTTYIDNIELDGNANATNVSQPLVLKEAKGYDRHVDLSWNAVTEPGIKYVKIFRAMGTGEFAAVDIQSAFTNRYADFTGKSGATYRYKIATLDANYNEGKLSNEITASTRKLTDDELLSMVQKACFRYYWEGAEPSSGLARENIHGRRNMIATGASGFGIMAMIVGAERNFISRKEAVERFVLIVDFLNKADKFHGVVPHFIDGPSGKVEPFFGPKDNGGDLVEHSFLMQGLLAARAYFNRNDPKEKHIRDGITKLWEETDWEWYRREKDSKFLYWHWSPDQAWVLNHRLIGWNETMVTYLLAIASPTHAVPASLYYSGWANQGEIGQKYRSGWGGTKEGSMYTNGNSYEGIKLDVGVSSGGPLFFTHYSYMGYDPHFITDRYTNYFINNQNIARINYRYCVRNPKKQLGYGDSAWGLTASDGPYDYSADEPTIRQDRGKIAPTGALSSFPYTPVESMKALKNYYYKYGHFLWGEYGFRDAFSLEENWASEIYMGLNQAPMTVMIENYRTGLIWKLFMSDVDVQRGLKKLEAETKAQSK